jgi:hypothetical protein
MKTTAGLAIGTETCIVGTGRNGMNLLCSPTFLKPHIIKTKAGSKTLPAWGEVSKNMEHSTTAPRSQSAFRGSPLL